jgi:hypothetical protein
MCESKSITLFVIVCSNPLRTLTAIISVATPSAIPMIEIVEIRLMKRESFLDRIKFFAIYQETFIIKLTELKIRPKFNQLSGYVKARTNLANCGYLFFQTLT